LLVVFYELNSSISYCRGRKVAEIKVPAVNIFIEIPKARITDNLISDGWVRDSFTM